MPQIFLIIVLLWSWPLFAQTLATTGSHDLTASEARALFETGEIVLIDIRQPEEWRELGVPEGAVRISMAHPEGGEGFLRDLLAAVEDDMDAPIVLICRTGNRSSQVVPALQRWGFTQVYHVPEGMLGSRYGPGWIRSGLPIDDCSHC
ncbi:MAG: rhodanese-like domain-containing protein [Wenzhouxiangella sp.]